VSITDLQKPPPPEEGAAGTPAPRVPVQGTELRPVRRRRARLAVGGSELLSTIERRLGFTAGGLIVGGFAIAGLIVGHYFANRTLMLFVYGVVVLVVGAWLLGRHKLSVTATRSDLPSRVREGQLVDVELELKARRGISTVVLEEALHEQLGQTVRVPVSSLPSGQSVQHHYTFSPKLRGVYHVGPLNILWSDPVGLTRHRMVIAKPTKIIVHPVTEPVQDRVFSREWEDPPVRPPVSKPWPTGFEFYSMRDYVTGDDPRRIVWRATARVLDTETGIGRYLVRESEQGITDRVILILDTDVAGHSPGQPSDTFETAIKATASLGARHLRDGFSVTVEANSGKLVTELRGKRSEIQLLDALAALNRESDSCSKPMDRLLTRGQRNAHYVLVTPHISQKTAARLQLLRQRGTSLLVALVVWDETDPLVVHRAASLGCPVVELKPGRPMDRAFLRLAGMRR
jgi:uncharacterized protein (DUF58 family)